MSEIPAPIRAELDQTPAWWDRQFDALLKKQIPRDAAYHADHEKDEPITFWADDYAVRRYCAECGVTIDERRADDVVR